MEWEQTRSQFTKKHTGLTADEKIAFLFQPDTLLSAQYFENFRRTTFLEPEKRLMLAILEDAIKCFQKNLLVRSGRNKRLFEKAEQWITEVSGDWIFSFETICDTLGVNPELCAPGIAPLEGKAVNKVS